MSLFFIVCSVSLASAINCYSLTQGGGGSYGSYEAGAFTGLVNNLPAAEVSYYAVVGISAGSLNSIAISQFPQGSELAASAFINNTWLTLNGSESIFVEWGGGLVDGLLFHSGLYNTAPESKLLKKMITQPIQRKITMGTTNMSKGIYDRYNETIGLTDSIEAAMCSSAIPFLFATQSFNGYAYSDGGCYNMMDVATAVERCFEVTDKQSEIFVDMISCFRHVMEPEGKIKTLDVFYRAFEISSFAKTQKSLAGAMEAYPDVNFRYYIQPSIEVPWEHALNFTQELLVSLMNLGTKDAINVINNKDNMRDRFRNWSRYSDIIYP